MKGASRSAASVSGSPGTLGEPQTGFGFKAGISGAHTARTMMLADLTTLLAAAPKDAKREDFNRLIVEENVLGKRTTSNRWLTARHLADLHALDPGVTVFRLLRFFWNADAPSRPMLALLCAQARDALLRLSAKMVLVTNPAKTVVDSINFETASVWEWPSMHYASACGGDGNVRSMNSCDTPSSAALRTWSPDTWRPLHDGFASS